ncbi:DUF932 domain-containing protein [Escherichia coli]|nr:DUF932 domain-containing protein [Escherichia coli]
MPGYTEYVLAEGSFSYGQAVAVITAYRNVFIQDDPGMHFRRVIRNAEGQRRWRCRGYTKHMLRLRRAGEINGEHVPEIILLNSHDGTSSYQMLPGYFRFVCQNGCVCGQSLGEVRVPHRGNVVDRVIEGAYEVVGVFDRIEEKRDAMQSLILPPPARQALAQAALTYRYGDEHQPVTTADILTPRRREDYGKDLWSAYQTIQENMLKGGISGRSAKGKRIHTRAIHSIDTDIKLNRALWVMAETLLESLR